MSVFLTHSYENIFLLPLIPLHTSTLAAHPSWDASMDPAQPFSSFPTINFLLKPSSCSDLGSLCSHLLQYVLSPGIVHLLSLPAHPQSKLFLNPDHHCHHCDPHTLHWHGEGVGLLVSPVQPPLCALLSAHTHLLSPVLGRARSSLSTLHVCIVHCKIDPQL